MTMTVRRSHSHSHSHSQRRPSRTRFEQVYGDRYESMVQLACGMVDRRAVAEEIVQESFQQLWQRWEQVSQPSSYLRTSVVNGCHNELRRRRVRRDAWPKLVVVPECSTVEYLADALAEVNERRRRALVLRYYGDCSIAEIAAVMDIPAGTAKSLIHRGLADLRLAIA
jgi:DNA-directed RNA polymerase specialized sigma24 family protein